MELHDRIQGAQRKQEGLTFSLVVRKGGAEAGAWKVNWSGWKVGECGPGSENISEDLIAAVTCREGHTTWDCKAQGESDDGVGRTGKAE